MRHRLLPLAALTLAFAALTACGGGDDEPAAATSAAPGGEYAACLRQNGVELPEGFGAGRSGGPRPSGDGRPSGGTRPSGGPGGIRPSGQPGGGFGNNPPEGVSAEAWQKAQEACSGLRPSGGPGGGGLGNDGASAAYRTCLSDHGVTPEQMNATSDPTVASAIEACAALRPSARPRPSS